VLYIIYYIILYYYYIILYIHIYILYIIIHVLYYTLLLLLSLPIFLSSVLLLFPIFQSLSSIKESYLLFPISSSICPIPSFIFLPNKSSLSSVLFPCSSSVLLPIYLLFLSQILSSLFQSYSNSSSLSSSTILEQSFYTCRYFDRFIYIQSFFSNHPVRVGYCVRELF